MLRWVIDWKFSCKNKEGDAGRGVLFCSGLIAGEGLVGILLAVLAVLSVNERIQLSEWLNTGTAGGIVLMLFLVLALFRSAKCKTSTDTHT